MTGEIGENVGGKVVGAAVGSSVDFFGRHRTRIAMVSLCVKGHWYLPLSAIKRESTPHDVFDQCRQIGREKTYELEHVTRWITRRPKSLLHCCKNDEKHVCISLE